MKQINLFYNCEYYLTKVCSYQGEVTREREFLSCFHKVICTAENIAPHFSIAKSEFLPKHGDSIPGHSECVVYLCQVQLAWQSQNSEHKFHSIRHDIKFTTTKVLKLIAIHLFCVHFIQQHSDGTHSVATLLYSIVSALQFEAIDWICHY